MSTVLFLSLVGPPDGVSTARLIGGLAGGLHELGHCVTVLTTAPHYNRDRDAERGQPIRWGRLGVVGRSEVGGVRFLHVAMPRKGVSVALRILAWLWFHAISTVVAWFTLPRFDVVIAPSPPLTVGVSGWLICRVRGSSLVYNVQEIYPDVAVQLGALRRRTVIRALSRLERFVYGRADAVTVISAGMIANLRAKGVPAEKLELIPNHVDVVDLSVVGPSSPFSREYGLDGKFVVTYAGNIGKPQDLEIVVSAAELLRPDPSIFFLIVGDGADRRRIENLVSQKGLLNIVVLPHQPYSAVPHIYAASSVCLVLQAAGTGATTLPSKAVQIVGAGRPFVAVADAASDLAAFTRSAGSGLVVAPGRSDELASDLRQMRDQYETWRQRAEAARSPVIEEYSKAHVVDAYSRLIGRLPDRARA